MSANLLEYESELRRRGGQKPLTQLAKAVRNMVLREAVGAVTTSDVSGASIDALAARYIGAVQDRLLPDVVSRYATILPQEQRQIMLASGFNAGEVGGGQAKAVTKPTLNPGEMFERKCSGIVVASRELLATDESVWLRLFSNELETTVGDCINETFLGAFSTGNIAGTGDIIDDVATALSQPTMIGTGFVVAANPQVVNELAVYAEGRPGFGVRGGQWAPDLWILPVKSVDYLVCIAASRVALTLFPLEIDESQQATIEMDTAPSSDSNTPAETTQVNMFQTNSVAVLVERRFRVRSTTPSVTVTLET